MGKLKKKNALSVGYKPGKALNLLLKIMHEQYTKESREEKIEIIEQLLAEPKAHIENERLSPVARVLLGEEAFSTNQIPLRVDGIDYAVYGREGIDKGSFQQIDVASRLPISLSAALMPDAHTGYGLPIGGVLATENAVIPFGVGVDIGCRMCLSVYHLNEKYLKIQHRALKDMLVDNTRFGPGKGFEQPMDDEILERKEFQEIAIVKQLKDRAYKQIGSSGGGNHFVEFGIVEMLDPENEFDMPVGKYLAVLSHSGSRGLGANIANHYTKVAMKKTPLPKEAKHLAWLDLDTEEGQEYWLAMNLAGDYASACHHQIHKRMAKSLGEKPAFMVENHHNFAWKEQLEDGTEVIVHRKGATPAGKGVLGIIPGSMTSPGFIVRGKGNPRSINSASHGAGRVMSRTRAKNSITRNDVRKVLNQNGVTLIGGGVDEAPMVYKDIHQVMAFQQDLVEVVGSFTPKIVRMAK